MRVQHKNAVARRYTNKGVSYGGFPELAKDLAEVLRVFWGGQNQSRHKLPTGNCALGSDPLNELIDPLTQWTWQVLHRRRWLPTL